ncbi:MAG: hypothetical protein BWY76_02851 [bacterium ADurb.Bin429]|nr:MAG: hypothetical protein BWY76_02851 [bacterium ADurb.Bin429]
MRQAVYTEQPTLQTVVTGNSTKMCHAGVEHRMHRLGIHLVGQVARRLRMREPGEAVVDGFIVDQRIRNVGIQTAFLAQAGGQTFGGGATDFPPGVMQFREDLRFGNLRHAVAVRHREGGGGDDLVEQARKRLAAGGGFFQQDALFRLGEAVRALGARMLKVMTISRGDRVLKQRGEGVIRNGDELQFEENKVLLDGHRALLHALQQRAVRGVGALR